MRRRNEVCGGDEVARDTAANSIASSPAPLSISLLTRPHQRVVLELEVVVGGGKKAPQERIRRCRLRSHKEHQKSGDLIRRLQRIGVGRGEARRELAKQQKGLLF